MWRGRTAPPISQYSRAGAVVNPAAHADPSQGELNLRTVTLRTSPVLDLFEVTHDVDQPLVHHRRLVENCADCRLHVGGFFCDLTDRTLKELEQVTFPAFYPRGSMLFVEGQEPRGVFILCRGRVKLAGSSLEGRTLDLQAG